jgi:glyoxylase-like metal-dependent hydrolase (beta-lactamase superfamily II)
MVDASVTVLDRGSLRTDVNHIVENFSVGTATEPNPDTVMGEGPVYNLVIDHPEATVLWDTGSHPEAGEGHWPAALYDAFEHYDADEHPLPEDLDEVGYAVEDIDAVIQTHLHIDHAGGLEHFAGTDVPIYVHEDELKFAYYSAKSDAGDDAYVAADFDHDLNWAVVHGDRTMPFADLELLHLPGHTPGQLGVKLDLDGFGTALFAGDEAFSRANYDGEQPMGGPLLWSKRDWFESLQFLKDLERRTDAAVYCGHDADDMARMRDELP